MKQELMMLKMSNESLKTEINVLKENKNMDELIIKKSNEILEEKVGDLLRQMTALKEEYNNELTLMKKKLNILDKQYNDIKKVINKDDKVLLFLKSINMDMYYNILSEQGFNTMNDLKYITKEMLTEMGITRIAHYTKILAKINQYNINSNDDNNNDNTGETTVF